MKTKTKKIVISCVAAALCIIVAAVGVYVYISPPNASAFEMWEAPPKEDVFEDAAVLRYLRLEDAESETRKWLYYEVENTSDDQSFECAQEQPPHRIDYHYLGRWHTVVLAPAQDLLLKPTCDPHKIMEVKCLLPEEVVTYEGKYRFYHVNIGYVEFEIS